MKIETTWNSGTFTLAHSADIPEEMIPIVLAFGVRQIVQRNSKHDKVLGAFTTDRALAHKPKGDGPWRKKDWTRGSVEYTDALARQLEGVYSKIKLSEDEDGEAVELPITTVASRYDGAIKAEPKFAREKKKFAEKESSEAGLEAWLKSFVGYTGATHGEDGEYSTEALAATKIKIDAFLEAALKAGGG